jgi:hypothetical protein
MVCDNAAKESQMIKTRIVSSLFILVLVGAVAQAMPKAPREVFGLRLGMSEALVHKLLRKT